MNGVHPWRPVDTLGWAPVVSSLNALAKRNPNFRVVLRGEFPLIYGTWCDRDGAHSFSRSHFPIIPPKSFVTYEYVPHVENRVLGFGDL